MASNFVDSFHTVDRSTRPQELAAVFLECFVTIAAHSAFS